MWQFESESGINSPVFPEVKEVIEVCSVNDTIKTTVHNKGVIEACKSNSKECLELQRRCNRTLRLENQSCLSRSKLRARLENNLSRVENAWPEDEDEGETVPVRESDTKRKLDAQLNKIFLTTPILSENLSV